MDAYRKRANSRRVRFGNKWIYLKANPRTGVCQRCGRSVASGEIKRTSMAHLRYDPVNPLAHTVEVCNRCHARVDTTRLLRVGVRNGRYLRADFTKVDATARTEFFAPDKLDFITSLVSDSKLVIDQPPT